MKSKYGVLTLKVEATTNTPVEYSSGGLNGVRGLSYGVIESFS